MLTFFRNGFNLFHKQERLRNSFVLWRFSDCHWCFTPEDTLTIWWLQQNRKNYWFQLRPATENVNKNLFRNDWIYLKERKRLKLKMWFRCVHVKNRTNMIVYGSNLHKGLNVLNIKVPTSNNRHVLFGVPLKRERTCVYVPQCVVELQWIIKPSEILLLLSVLHVHRKRGDN